VIDQALVDNLRHGAEVMSTDGKEIGELYAVVVDPRDNQVPSFVVNKGPHFPAPGFGAPDLIIVPIEGMADAQEKK
jgi:sporulation protein YlmC with PRC-barrel domain